MARALMKIGITGALGFLGWHVSSRLRAVHGIEAVRWGRDDLDDPQALVASLGDVDAVLHLAGVNRGSSSGQVEPGNAEVAARLADALGRVGRPIDVVYANSVHSRADTAYGRGKKRSAEILEDIQQRTGGAFADVLLPNVFGEHGKPDYNSFIATFVDRVVTGRPLLVTDDREIDLIHAQDAAELLIAHIGRSTSTTVRGTPRRISEIAEWLQKTHDLYNGSGHLPDLSDPFDTDLFNTYRSARPPKTWAIKRPEVADARGRLFELGRMGGGAGQVFASVTRPGAQRGHHFHLRRVERFAVVHGSAEIRLRRLLDDVTVVHEVRGEDPVVVDMPTLWVHSLRNTGVEDLITVFWSNQLLDASQPDQYPEEVDQ